MPRAIIVMRMEAVIQITTTKRYYCSLFSSFDDEKVGKHTDDGET
jgi:hypothetical protein